MQLSDERIIFFQKLVIDYEEFLAKKHPGNFYDVILKIPDRNKIVNRTNEQHCQALIDDAKDQLFWFEFSIPL